MAGATEEGELMDEFVTPSGRVAHVAVHSEASVVRAHCGVPVSRGSKMDAAGYPRCRRCVALMSAAR